jgi:hypothetical protein
MILLLSAAVSSYASSHLLKTSHLYAVTCAQKYSVNAASQPTQNLSFEDAIGNLLEKPFVLANAAPVEE